MTPSEARTPNGCLAEQMHYRHDYGQGKKSKAERRTLIVTALTVVTMIAEIFGF